MLTCQILFCQRTKYKFKPFLQSSKVNPVSTLWQLFKADLSEFESCLRENSCKDKECSICYQGHIWITKTGGTNFPQLQFIGSVLQDIIRDHLQFTDEVISKAKASIHEVETNLKLQNNDENLGDQKYVGVHVRWLMISFYELHLTFNDFARICKAM